MAGSSSRRYRAELGYRRPLYRRHQPAILRSSAGRPRVLASSAPERNLPRPHRDLGLIGRQCSPGRDPAAAGCRRDAADGTQSTAAEQLATSQESSMTTLSPPDATFVDRRSYDPGVGRPTARTSPVRQQPRGAFAATPVSWPWRSTSTSWSIAAASSPTKRCWAW